MRWLKIRRIAVVTGSKFVFDYCTELCKRVHIYFALRLCTLKYQYEDRENSTLKHYKMCITAQQKNTYIYSRIIYSRALKCFLMLKIGCGCGYYAILFLVIMYKRKLPKFS